MTAATIHCLGLLVLDRIVEVDRLPGHDEKAMVAARRETAGGPARNVAAALAAWGERAVLISAIGDDAAGGLLIDSLGADGLGPEGIAVVGGMATGTTIIIVDATGEKAILIDPVAESVLAGIGRDLMPEPGDVVVANLYHPGAVTAAFAQAAACRAASVIDLELPEIERWGWDAAFETAAGAGLTLTNRQVLSAWTASVGVEGTLEDGAERLARRLAGEGRRACVTLGDLGLVACDAGRIVRVPALPVKARDTTGAGDTFLAAFIHAERLGKSFDDALALASAAAGLFVQSGRPSWPEVELRARPIG
ncbi:MULTISPECIES: PfkB family carbohydrate kinase [Rhodomicrobium]|uniref:carbohydrate kinase family protein n=1 Tax=Rhodomicrobium TaxID=1068 RepID=UPI00148285F3|nr:MULTISPECIES: PfkB family carbohydrate kinase [Rhodomicrobium]